MKTKITLINICIVLFAINTICAQEPNLLSLTPHIGQGYVVLDANDEINEEYFEIRIYERTFNASGFEDEIVEIYELVGTNYKKIPFSYINNGYYLLEAIAHTPGGDVVSDKYELDLHLPYQTPGGGNSVLTGETHFKCDGPSYAWMISQYIWDNAESEFHLDAAAYAVDPSGKVVVPYYEYFSANSFTQLQKPYVLPIHNYLGTGIDCPNPYYGASINEIVQLISTTSLGVVRLQNVPGVTYYNRQNTPITSSIVYGVRKSLGPWATGDQNHTTDYYAIGTPLLSTDKPLAMNFIDMNDDNNGDLLPDMECASNVNNPQNSNPLIDQPWDSAWVDHEDDFIRNDTVIWPWETFGHADAFINGENQSDWWTDYISFGISSVSKPNGEICFFNVDSWVNGPGDPENLSLSLNPGLYSVNLQLADGRFMPIMMEIEGEDNQNSNTLASMMSATIYPNPIQEDYFHINLTSTESLVTNYKLYDFNGNLLYESEIEIIKGRTANVFIEPDSGIPQGVLVNVFQFEDGSQIQKLTIK